MVIKSFEKLIRKTKEKITGDIELPEKVLTAFIDSNVEYPQIVHGVFIKTIEAFLLEPSFSPKNLPNYKITKSQMKIIYNKMKEVHPKMGIKRNTTFEMLEKTVARLFKVIISGLFAYFEKYPDGLEKLSSFIKEAVKALEDNDVKLAKRNHFRELIATKKNVTHELDFVIMQTILKRTSKTGQFVWLRDSLRTFGVVDFLNGIGIKT
jgi:hypothetical protein